MFTKLEAMSVMKVHCHIRMFPVTSTVRAASSSLYRDKTDRTPQRAYRGVSAQSQAQAQAQPIILNLHVWQ